MKTLGQKIAELRKVHQLTQEELAERMYVSSQAVSKWENDLSVPDVSALIQLSDEFHVTLDELLKNEEPKVQLLPETQRRSMDEMVINILVREASGTNVRLSLPLSIVKLAVEIGMELPQISSNEQIKKIDLEKVFALVEQGVVGRLIEVHDEKGTDVIIEVE